MERMGDATYAVEIRGLTKAYGSFIALDHLDMTIRKGEFMGLLGPNGSGKSTTLKLLTNLINPTEGEALIDGINVHTNHRLALARVGCVVETPNYYERFTPYETLDYIGELRGLSRAERKIRIRDALEEVRMWEWKDKAIGQFSKGMRQRVGLAQVLLPNPEVIILDEPTSGLDPRGMIEMRAVLASLKNDSRSLLISTHMLKEVSEICESVTMIRAGRSVISDNVSELVHNISTASPDALSITFRTHLAMTPEFVRDMSAAAGVREVEKMGDYQLRVKFSGSNDDQANLVDIVCGHGLRLLAMNEKGADLESLYMEMTDGTEGVR